MFPSLGYKKACFAVAVAVCTTALSGVSCANDRLSEKQINDFYEYSEQVMLAGKDAMKAYIEKYLHKDALISQNVRMTLPDGEERQVSVEYGKNEFLQETMASYERSGTQAKEADTQILETKISPDGLQALVKTSNNIISVSNVQTAQGVLYIQSTMKAECQDLLKFDGAVGIVVVNSNCNSEIKMTPGQ